MVPQSLIGFDPNPERLQRALPATAFFAGFLWDALTLGRSVAPLDLWILSAYLAGAGALLWFLGRRQQALAALPAGPALATPPWWRESAPYFLLQFLFGGLLSALFIFISKAPAIS